MHIIGMLLFFKSKPLFIMNLPRKKAFVHFVVFVVFRRTFCTGEKKAKQFLL